MKKYHLKTPKFNTLDSGYNGEKFALAVWLMMQARVEVMHRTEPKEIQIVESEFRCFNNSIWRERLKRYVFQFDSTLCTLYPSLK